ncbi:RNA methyltransferase tRNA(m5U54)methyltransferase [Blyttiomyces sp. JEL0837]|nr:RNA methyltransferase tRNA(m5U54)methyltransferase [Blyttiomyces sp. JEL0837]
MASINPDLEPIQEGQAFILKPKDKPMGVFYNNVQEFNRDMSIATINTWAKMFTADIIAKREKKLGKKAMTGADKTVNETPPKITVLEALSATGLRAIRYAKECPDVHKIIANDMDKVAVEAIQRNVKFNMVEDKVQPNQGDANLVMYQAMANGQRYHVIDLDPYGTAVPFIDAAIKGVDDGGLLCVTCTDMATLAGGQIEACWTKYGSMPVPNAQFCHEMALRMLLHTLSTTAARYKKVITPLMSCSIDFYVRVFVRVRTAPNEAVKAASCTGCKTYSTQPMGTYVKGEKKDQSVRLKVSGPPVNMDCAHCNQKHHIGGPYYSGKIHDKGFLESMLKYVKEEGETKFGTHERMLGMLTVMQEVIDIEIRTFIADIEAFLLARNLRTFNFSTASPIVNWLLQTCSSSSILNAGYKVSLSHCATQSIKTTAPPEVLWDIMRGWVKKHPVNPKNLGEKTVAKAILDVKPKIEADFSEHPEANPPSRKFKLVRYQENPEKNWGPKAKPGAEPRTPKTKRPANDDNNNGVRDSKKRRMNESNIDSANEMIEDEDEQ